MENLWEPFKHKYKYKSIRDDHILTHSSCTYSALTPPSLHFISYAHIRCHCAESKNTGFDDSGSEDGDEDDDDDDDDQDGDDDTVEDEDEDSQSESDEDKRVEQSPPSYK